MLLDETIMNELFTTVLVSCSRLLFSASFVLVRDVRRIPLKPIATTPEEKAHLQLSSDGLRYFFPVDIYEDNIVSSKGLIAVLHRLHLLEGFGLTNHSRTGKYSLLHCDVAVFWQLIRLLYCYSGLTPLRHDLGLFLGLWHPYLYAHVALWDVFRDTFLGPVFFTLFPSQVLLRKPKLNHSSTLLTWLRLAYPIF